MSANWKSKLQEYATRQHLRVLAFAVFWISVGILIWSAIDMRVRDGTLSPIPAPATVYVPHDVESVSSDATTTGPIAPASEPVRLRIPSLSIDAAFETPLGLNDDGSVGVPVAFDTVGWYKYGPTPGELGPAVILGHVDSYKGAAVFYHLGQLKEGDTVEVERADGSTAVFEVTGYERVAQSEFPMDRVYGNIPYSGIRLITCSGTYNRETHRYDRNLIVYGKLKDVRYIDKMKQ